jgi:competence protein ComEC
VTTTVALVGLSLATMALRLTHLHSDPFAEWVATERHVQVVATLTSDPAFSDRPGFGSAGGQQAVVRLRVESASSGRSEITGRLPVLLVGDASGWEGLHFGDRVQVSGTLRQADAAEPIAALVFSTAAPREVSPAPAAVRAAETMRAGLRDAVAGLPERVQGLLPALVVGDTSRMSGLLASDMKASGLAHLTAVSGANVAIVAGAVLLLARLLGVRAYWLMAVGLAAVSWFVLLARPQPSVLRAAVMGALALLAVAAAGRTQAARMLLASVVALLLIDPWLARSWGFALSVAATVGLVLLARPLADHLPSGLPVVVRDAAGVAVAAQLATLPLVLALSGQIPLLGVLANVVVTPAVPMATVLGVAAAAVSPVSPPAAAACAWLAQWPTLWITGVAGWAATSPLATLPWPSGWRGALLGLLTLLLGAAALGLGVRRRWVSRRRVAATLLTLAVVAAFYSLGPGRWPPPGWVLVACDVGQGDALAVNLGPGAAMVVDAGPDPDLVDRCLDRLGVSEVPLLVLTHFHADHVGGLPGVLEGRTVGQVLVTPLRAPAPQVDQVARWTSGLVVNEARPGQTGGWGTVTWQVLWPGDLIDQGDADGSAPNNASAVLDVDASGVRLLLTGDIEPPAQAALVEQGVPTVDVLKLAHHGSKYQDPAFLAATGARVALVSVGADNGYGHPDPGLLETLERAGVVVARTDQLGSVAVVSEGSALRVVPMP